MNALGPNTRVYLATGATDLRKAIDGLSILVAERLALDPFSSHLFAFCNRSKSNVKILYWERNGFCLWQKRLERHRFAWPESGAKVLDLDSRQLAWLLDGLDPLNIKAHQSLKYSMLI